MDPQELPSDIFSTIKFYVIGEINSEAEKLLLEGGAQKHQYLSDILTHCIADNFDEEIVEAKELFQLNVVKSSWITKSLLCRCLLPAKAFDADFPRNLFTGVIACPSELSKADHLLLWSLITSNNGEYKTKYDATITHLITNSTSGVKYESACKSNVKVVSAHWVTESVFNKKRMVESRYHPKQFTICSMSPLTEQSQEALDEKLLESDSSEEVSEETCRTLQEIIKCDSDKIVEEPIIITTTTNAIVTIQNNDNDDREIYCDSPSKEFIDQVKYYGHDSNELLTAGMFLQGCVFYICDYPSDLGKEEINLWEQVIELHGGQVNDNYSPRITHVLCEHQKSNTFQQALKDNKRLVTACWLNDCLVQKCMLIPSSILHVPNPFGKEKPCANQIISVTNYEGTERMEIKKLILMLGAKYSGCMTRSTSVLLAKGPSGSKYNKAMEWNVPVVTLEWLVELACGNLEATRLPASTQFSNFNYKGLPNLQEKSLYLLNGWRVPLKLPKDLEKDHHDANPTQPPSFESLTSASLENKENLLKK